MLNKKNKNEKYSRSATYRYEFIKNNPGYKNKYYMCAYCGAIIKKDKMQVDHVIPVNVVKKNIFARILVPDGINSQRNLVAACRICNAKKSDKTGLWTIRGMIGKQLWTVVWITLILALISFFVYFFVTKMTPQNARNIIDGIVRKVGYILSRVEERIISVK